ncbi:MAG: B12-binding domain-containing radical SAM protein [Spirochaetes bacterium]|nr:B12-binding domain-containing radical SAM protein [Spirochaetota bacterium]
MPTKRLVLINPVGRRSGYMLSRFSLFPPLSLAYVAAVTPDSWEVNIVDENFGQSTLEEADLVGITAFTSNIGRAYQLAAQYREKGIPVVLGGIHASMLSKEALQFANAVVKGEVEGIWGKVLQDFEKKQLGGIYQGPVLDLSTFNVLPRRDLLHPGYLWNSIQTSRGCPFDCSFCSVSRYMGKAYRQRTASSVLQELSIIPGQYLFFLDDNLIGYSTESRKRAIQIFRGMIDSGIQKIWWMQASINVAEDPEVLRLASQAGCAYVFIGFETTDVDALKGMHKGVNLKTGVDNYRTIVRRLHEEGIGVLGAFILGNDHETPQYYEDLARFILSSGIDMVQISILTPLPGTALMDQLQAEGRLLYNDFPFDWEKFRFSYLTHRPTGIDPETVYTADNYIKKRLYSFPTYPFRLLRSFFWIRNPQRSFIVYKLNDALKRSWQNSHYRWTYPDHFSPYFYPLKGT